MLLPKIRFVLFFAALFFGGNAYSQAETRIKEDASITRMR